MPNYNSLKFPIASRILSKYDVVYLLISFLFQLIIFLLSLSVQKIFRLIVYNDKDSEF